MGLIRYQRGWGGPVHPKIVPPSSTLPLPPEISYAPRDSLRAWQEKNIQWLEWTDVHRETTRGIKVTVIPFYVGYKASSSSTTGGHVHWWRYNIRLENLTGERVQLRERYWKIFSTSGTLETVKGKGVVGQVSKWEGLGRSGEQVGGTWLVR